MQVIYRKTKSKLNRELELSHGKLFGKTRLGSLASFFGLIGIGSLLSLPLITVSSASASDLNYNVQIRPSLNVTVSSSTVSLLLNPGNTPYGTSDLSVSVGTNNFTGYKLYINADSTELTNNGYSTPSYIDTLDDTATDDAQYDVRPASWRLPTGGPDGEF